MKRFGIISLSALLICLSIPVGKSSADEQFSCGQTEPSMVTAITKVPTDSPDVYVRATLPEDQVTTKFYAQGMSTDNEPCVLVGSLKLTKNWQKIGSLPSRLLDKQITLTLTLTNESPSLGASAPQAVFTSTAPPCQLTVSCFVPYEGGTFELSPKKLSNSYDDLRVGLLSDPGGEAVKKVIYSVDGEQVYTSKTLEQFKLKYVAGGQHSLERTVILESGKTLSDSKQVTKGTFGNATYLITSVLNRYSKLVAYVLILIGLILVWIVSITIARMVYKRRQWRATHIAGAVTNFDPSKAGPQAAGFDSSVVDVVHYHKKAMIVAVSCLMLVFVAYSFVLTTFKVDGVSMDPTLVNKSNRPLFILPAVIGKIGGSGYTPPRGTIVVVLKDDNNLFDESVVQKKSYVVKRVVGLPEERVVVNDGKIYVYNKQNPEGFVPDDKFKWIKDTTGSEYIKIDVTLKQNELFVIGDNRDESIDSRFYGPVQASQIIGKVL